LAFLNCLLIIPHAAQQKHRANILPIILKAIIPPVDNFSDEDSQADPPPGPV
jgi:hypothetical protein